MSEDPRKTRLALDNSPDIAREIGLLLSCFAIIELAPPHLLAKLIGVTTADAEVILGHFRSIAHRLDLIDNLAANRAPGDVTDKVRALSKRIRDSITARNKYAHGLFEERATGGLHVVSWLADATRKNTAEPVSVESVREDCATLRALLCDVINFSQIVVPPVPPKERAPSFRASRPG